MKYLFELNHPKHYYQFKYIIEILKSEGHTVNTIARDKDVLLNVLKEEGVEYELFGSHKKNIIAKLLGTFAILHSYSRLVKKYQSDMIVSKASIFGAIIAKIYGKKSVIFPDSEVVFITNKLVVPLVDIVVTPETFERDYGKKHHRVKGFFENCYLNPNVFSPNFNTIEKYGIKKPFAVFRFIGWNANHDIGKSGFSIEQKKELINIVEKHFNVYVSSEKELPEELERYRLKSPSNLIHHVLFSADMYVGDSQTMATEAALLGTPSIRSNSFVGENDMSNFKILEQKYKLLFNISDYGKVVEKAKELSEHSEKENWLAKRERYNELVGDINKQIADILSPTIYNI